MEKTSHILIVGPAAEQLGYAHGLERADPHYFFVQERYDQLCEARR
jgi:isoaspartyl peptidase/L-asparaginase-like protein (Ntn-hydrolase superfamily)